MSNASLNTLFSCIRVIFPKAVKEVAFKRNSIIVEKVPHFFRLPGLWCRRPSRKQRLQARNRLQNPKLSPWLIPRQKLRHSQRQKWLPLQKLAVSVLRGVRTNLPRKPRNRLRFLNFGQLIEIISIDLTPTLIHRIYAHTACSGLAGGAWGEAFTQLDRRTTQ